MKRNVRIAAIAAVAALTIAAGKPASNWLATINVTANGGHVLGNPEAEVKLTEYVSYTCKHCGTFHKEADSALKLAYVQPGKLSLEIQNVILNPVDLTVAMLTHCGKPGGFFQRHNDFLAGQDKWLGKLDSINKAQQARWYNGSMATRLQAVASDFGFYRTMEKRGLSPAQVNRCLNDEAMADRIASQTRQASELGVNATPSFAINGQVLAGTHNWKGLSAKLTEQF